VNHRERALRVAQALVFVVTALWGHLALAADVSVTPTSGPGGTVVTATSSGFDPTFNTGFYITTDNMNYGFVGACPGTSGTDAYGNCSIPITMPGPTRAYTVAAFNSIGEFASTTFEALKPSLEISPTCGPDSTASIVVTGERWAVGFDAGIYLDGGLVRANNRPPEDGSFTQTIVGPSSDGAHTIRVFNSVGQDLSEAFTTPVCGGIGSVIDLDGTATVTHADGSSGPLAVGNPIKQDDTIAVGPQGRVVVLLHDNTTITLSASTRLTFDQYVYNPTTNEGSTFSQVLQGAFQYVSGLIAHKTDPDNQVIDVKDVAGVGIRGTTFITQIADTNAEIDLLAGSVDVSPYQTLTTTAYTGPVRIVFDSHGSSSSPLTEDEYNAIRDRLFSSAPSDSTPPQVTLAFPNAPAGQAGFFNASQVPVFGTATAADASNVTAIGCSDGLFGLSPGVVSGLNTTTAQQALSLSGDGTHVVSCTAVDALNNSGAAAGSMNSATVTIDATAPTISYSSHPATYDLGQTIAITCTADDELSGLASSTCQNITGSASSFGLGLHTFNATAQDKAGNTNSASTQFTVVDSYDGLIALVNLYETKPGVAATMVSTLRSAQASADAGNASAANNQLNAFINQVQAQVGKSLTAEQAATLIRLTNALKM